MCLHSFFHIKRDILHVILLSHVPITYQKKSHVPKKVCIRTEQINNNLTQKIALPTIRKNESIVTYVIYSP